jgi:hypothetical protein
VKIYWGQEGDLAFAPKLRPLLLPNYTSKKPKIRYDNSKIKKYI